MQPLLLPLSQARIRGLQWRNKIVEKKKISMANIPAAQDNANKAKTIIDGATVSANVLLYCMHSL